jgi:hypothetical protein
MRKRTLILWKRILTRLGLFVIIAGGLFVYFHTGLFTLHSYDLAGVPEEYVSLIQKNMYEIADQKLYKILPGNRSLSYHDDAIRALVMDTLPNTKDISIRPAGLHTLKVRVTSYTPLFSVGEGYAISDDATVYKEIIPLAEYPHLEIASTTQVKPQTLIAISALSKKIGDVLFKIDSISIDEYGDIRFYSESRNSYVIISSGSDEDRVWSNILSAIDTDPLKKSLAENLQALDYIDARFGNKIFYKFTNAPRPVIIPDTNDTPTSTPESFQ